MGFQYGDGVLMWRNFEKDDTGQRQKQPPCQFTGRLS